MQKSKICFLEILRSKQLIIERFGKNLLVGAAVATERQAFGGRGGVFGRGQAFKRQGWAGRLRHRR
jgi:hypothetical protein